ncbi:hypothetical protein BJV74DRAFT_793071 [Russula compacta]|nr:hypothetical protein BJV74DRAFT_793071 [Russula compacta]
MICVPCGTSVTMRSEISTHKYPTDPPRYYVQNKHQAELVAQLRQEAQQWKDQCLRLEETLRGEIKAWKDQFLRIDAEHTRLLNQLSSAPSSQTRLTAHTPKHVPILAPDFSAMSPATKRGASACSSTDKPPYLPAHHPPTKAPPVPRVVRRVQAVIEVPVKEEEEEEGGEGVLELGVEWPDPAAAALPPTSTMAAGGARRGGARRRKSSAASSHQRSLVAPSHEGSYGYIDGEEPPSDEEADDGGQYVDEEEVENAIATSSTPQAAGRKTIPWGRKHMRHEPDEEDDELMMYAKDNPHKVRPLQHENRLPQPPRHKSITDATVHRLSAANAAVQKRRTTEAGAGGAARTKRRR